MRIVLRAPTLTHRNKRGELYLGIEEVEEQIGVALSLGRGALLERALNRDHKSTGYLGPECSERMRKRVWSWRVLQVRQMIGQGAVPKSAGAGYCGILDCGPYL